MIKAKFSFFQMQIKRVFRDSIKLGKSSLGKAPKRFNTIDMTGRAGKFIFAMLDAVVLVVSDIYKPL